MIAKAIREKMLLKLKEIAIELDGIRNRHWEEIAEKVYDYFCTAKLLDKNYPKPKMALELKISLSTLHRMVAYGKGHPEIKKAVKEHRISASAAGRICQRTSYSKQPEVLEYVIKNNVVSIELDRHITVDGIAEVDIIKERDYKNRWNISRDIKRVLHRLRVINLSLINVEVPKEEAEDVKSYFDEISELAITCRRRIK